MKHFIPDGTLDIVVLGPMDVSQPKAHANCVKLAQAINAVLKRPEFDALMKGAGFLGGYAVAPEDFGRNQVLNGVVQHLENADMAVIDLTARLGEAQPTPNVMYELGLVHALGLPFLLTRNKERSGGLPFYLNQTRVSEVSYDKEHALQEWVASELHAFLDPNDSRDFAENDVSDFFYGAPLIDISAATGVAVGYYDNFIFRLIGEPGGFFADPRYPFDTCVCVVPEYLPNTKNQDAEHLAALMQDAGITLEQATLIPKDPTDRPLNVKFTGKIVVDIPTTLYPLRRSPRLVRQRKLAARTHNARQMADERKMQARLIQQFLRMLRYQIDQDHADNHVRVSAIHFVSLVEVARKIRELQARGV